jgi:hypothetical protein
MKVRQLFAVLLHPKTYRMGKAEAFMSTGMTWGDPDSFRSVAYDVGRDRVER